MCDALPESTVLEALVLSLGRKEYAATVLTDLAAPFGISSGSVRTWLSRSRASGFLVSRREGRLAFYSLTERSRRISDNIALGFREPDWSEWDGSWRGVVFSIPEERKQERHRLRVKLEAYRFVPWYDGFWIRPFREGEIPDGRLAGEGVSEIRFRPGTPFTLSDAERLWTLPQLANQMEGGVALLENDLSGAEQLSPEEAHVRRIKTGNRVVPLIFSDPLLPPVLYPATWPGPALRRLFDQWDGILAKKARPFWNSLFEEKSK